VREALTRCLRKSISTLVVASLVAGCGGGGGSVDPKDNIALSKPRPGMEAMKTQMLEAFKKAGRDPAKVAPNLVK
jgi:hypothetical protein